MAFGDFRCRDFARLLAAREDHYPVSDRYIAMVHDSSDKTGSDEREHMVAWFTDNETKGAGSYSRSEGNASACRCYGRLQNAASLLWIAEAVGIPAEQVSCAYEAAAAAGDHRRACATIRKVIPWADIARAASALSR